MHLLKGGILKITGIDVTTIVVPLAQSFHGSNYTVSERCTLLVEVHTDAGVIGEAFVGDERTHYAELARLVAGPMRDAVLGHDLVAVERSWQAMFDVTHRLRNKALALRAVAAIDVAIWDAVGKACNRPIADLLGGYRSSLPIVAFHYGPDGQPLGTLVKDVASLLEAGYAGIKLKVGRGSVADDVKRVKAIRSDLGEDVILGCDANRNWTPEQAVEFARAVEDLQVDWLEEPVQWHVTQEGLRRVRASTLIPVAAGQSETTAEASVRLSREGAVDILNSDVAIIGGVTAWRRMAAAVSFDGTHLLHHEETHIACHLLASVAHGRYVEVFAERSRDPIWHDMVAVKPRIADGRIHVPARPGLGIELDRDFVARHAVDHR